MSFPVGLSDFRRAFDEFEIPVEAGEEAAGDIAHDIVRVADGGEVGGSYVFKDEGPEGQVEAEFVDVRRVVVAAEANEPGEEQLAFFVLI